MWKYYNPVKIIFSDYFIDELLKVVNKNKKILLICSERFSNTIHFHNIKKSFPKIYIFTDIENNPSFRSCNEAIKSGLKIMPEIIISIGGGSVIDTAKSVRLSLMTNSSCIENMLEQDLNYTNNIQLIAIPTTHGTSSEITKWATIWNKQEKKKYSLSDDKNYPDYAIYDYHLVDSLPLNISIITTLDCLSHSFEALWNKNANPISDDYAIKAIKLILENIEHLTMNTSKETRQNLLMATMCSGLAFSNTKTAAAHSISYPLTAFFGIPHGIACSMTLRSIMNYNYPSIKNKIRILLDQLKLDSIEEVWVIIHSVTKNRIKFSLREYGVTPNDLDLLVSKSFNKDRMGNNLSKITSTYIQKILKEVL